MKDLDDNQKLALLTESLLLEAKDRFLDALWNTETWRRWMAERPELAERKREHWGELIRMAKDFLKKYPSWSKELDWNNLESITPVALNDFVASCRRKEKRNEVFRSQRKSLKDYSPTGLFADAEGRRFNFIGTFRNWVAVQPLNWPAAVWCADYKVGGVPGKWCISNSHRSNDWDRYCADGSRFVFFLKKNGNPQRDNNIKCMVEYQGHNERDGWKCDGRPTIWTEVDNDIAPENWGDDGTYEDWIASQMRPNTLEDLMALSDRLEEPSYEERSVDDDDFDGFDEDFGEDETAGEWPA